MSNKKRELLAFVDARQKAFKEKYKGRKYATREEVESDLKELAKDVEHIAEEIKKHGTNPHEDRKTADELWNIYLDNYKNLLGLFKPPDEKQRAKIRANEKKLAALQKKIEKMEKEFEDRFGFPPPR